MRIVFDASALVELLLLSPIGEQAAPFVRAASGDIHLPHLADNESVSVLRGLALAGTLEPGRAAGALIDLRDFPAQRWRADALFERMWELRENVTAYDATYVALAEALDAVFVTADAKLARAVDGLAMCKVVLVASATITPPVSRGSLPFEPSESDQSTADILADLRTDHS